MKNWYKGSDFLAKQHRIYTYIEYGSTYIKMF